HGPGQPGEAAPETSRRELFPLLTPATPTAIDPVCGMTVDPDHAAGSAVYDGRTYYFCNPHCLHKFQADPQRYLSPSAEQETRSSTQPSHGQVEYICPMHPEVLSDRPGACPKCGMALEPRTVALEEGPNPELVDMSRRLWIGLVPSVLLLLLAMGDMLPGRPVHFLNLRLFNW